MAFNNAQTVVISYNCSVCGKPVAKRVSVQIRAKMKFFTCNNPTCKYEAKKAMRE